MKRGKWVFRYAIVGLLVTLCLLWCLYCNRTVLELRDILGSTEYIDLAARLDPLAVDLLNRLTLFEKLLVQSFWMLGITGGGLVLMIGWQILAPIIVKKWNQRSPKEKAPKITKSQAATPIQPPALKKNPGYCINCGAYYENLPDFCSECGAKQK
jgi:hypothetical protein